MIFVAESEKELGQKVWAEIKDRLQNGLRVGLTGDLGVGKTTLVQQIAKYLLIKDKITSPTFNIRKSYDIKNNKLLCLQHIDLYRIEKPSRVDLSQIKEWLSEESCLTFIEWINNAPTLKQGLNLIIEIGMLDKNKRKVKLIWL